MDIIEHYMASKTGNPETCEDGLVTTGHFIAVIDGATNKSRFSFQAKSPGRIARELIQEAIEALNPEITAQDALGEINRHIYAWYEARQILEEMRHSPEARCTASLVLYSGARRELWFIGDCQALVNGVPCQPQKKVDQIFSELRALLIYGELARGKTEAELLRHDTARERMLELLAFQTNLQNTFPENEFSYYVIDGFPCQAPNRLSVMPIDQEQGEIVLASDGYPRLFPTLAETEACLAGVLKEDPLCYKQYRTTKGRYGDNLSFDDRTYVRFTY